MISKELLSEVLGYEVSSIGGMLENYSNKTTLAYVFKDNTLNQGKRTINIYELAHKNLKQWAKSKNIFNTIDWSGEPEQIFKKVEELRNEVE